MDTAEQELQLAAFWLDSKLFAIDIMRIKEIVALHKLTGLPLQGTILAGMINLRDQVIPVMNLRTFFGMSVCPDTSGKLIVVSVSGRLIALAVDDLEEVITVPVHTLVSPPDMIDGAGSEYLVAVVLHGDHIYQILDIDALFTLSNRSEGRPPDADREGFKLLLDRL